MGVRPLIDSVGDCFENAMCESFFARSSASGSTGSGSEIRSRGGRPCSTSSRAGRRLERPAKNRSTHSSTEPGHLHSGIALRSLWPGGSGGSSSISSARTGARRQDNMAHKGPHVATMAESDGAASST